MQCASLFFHMLRYSLAFRSTEGLKRQIEGRKAYCGSICGLRLNQCGFIGENWVGKWEEYAYLAGLDAHTHGYLLVQFGFYRYLSSRPNQLNLY